MTTAMTTNLSDVAFSPAVKAVQTRKGSRAGYERMEAKGGWTSAVTPELVQFIARRDSLYIATASADGQPYVQHRGGKPGFLKLLDENTLAFADYTGNKQYITTGNLSENDKAYLFLMDYPNRRRIKIWGRAEVVEDDPALMAKLTDPDDASRPEQAAVFHIEAWDRNCPQYITPRYTEAESGELIASLRARISDLETEVAGLRNGAKRA